MNKQDTLAHYSGVEQEARHRAERIAHLTSMGFNFSPPAPRYEELLAVLRMIDNCVADSDGGTTLGSWEMGRVRAILARVRS